MKYFSEEKRTSKPFQSEVVGDKKVINVFWGFNNSNRAKEGIQNINVGSDSRFVS